MAAKTNIIVQTSKPNSQKTKRSTNENKNQAIIPTIISAQPSPISSLSAESSPAEVKSGNWSALILSAILPRSSLSLMPLYNPTARKRKKATDKMVVDNNEFSYKVLCSPRPNSQILRMVSMATSIVILKTDPAVTSFDLILC